MKNKKILVLSDLKKSTNKVLKNSVGLAKMVQGDIQFFHVTKPIEVVEQDNQLSAIRSINETQNSLKNKIEDSIKNITDNHGITIKYKFTIGNIKNEIGKYIEEVKPDIIVLGKRKPISFIGDNITGFILEKFKGIILITGDKSTLEPNENLSLGMLNANQNDLNFDLIENLISHSKKPLKSFNIVKNLKEFNKTYNDDSKKEILNYVFEENSNSIKNVSNFISKSDVNLLCFDRSDKTKRDINYTSVNKVIKNTDVSLLLTQ
ncbi:universal stress protein [Urechidicola croceus]|uniref:UspA domain-containing protein n=1 Tax=Urechidicola croceus TaxID=1850246 RepID=A0A1D8P9U0_9FLAO|nr:universal stress protein [Urechidicola croceus]AOW21305.1 hypothetical protein LPB138_11720 [Urechidicola croceus]